MPSHEKNFMNLIERWAQSQNLGPVTNNRRFAVTLDQVRVHLLELHPGQVDDTTLYQQLGLPVFASPTIMVW